MQFATIALADAKSTPVTHTFSAQQVESDGTVLLENRIGGYPVGFERLSIFARRRTASVNDSKYVLTLALPTLDISNPASPVVSYTDVCEIKLMSSAKGSGQNRKDLVKLASGLLANSSVITMLENAEGANL